MILHSDMNNFYASVEILYDPTLRDKPVAVAGDEEARHGIVLAKNDIAKRFGIRTGQVLWEARQQCPGLVCIPAHYERYLAFSAQARDIYTSYTDQVENLKQRMPRFSKKKPEPAACGKYGCSGYFHTGLAILFLFFTDRHRIKINYGIILAQYLVSCQLNNTISSVFYLLFFT